MFKDRKYFGDFLEAGEGISTNILANRLIRLEQAEIITKSQDPVHGKRFIYQLTAKGIALVPVMLELMKWAADYDDYTEMPRPFVRKLRNDFLAVESETISKLQMQD